MGSGHGYGKHAWKDGSLLKMENKTKYYEKTRSEFYIFKKVRSAALADLIPFLTTQNLSSYEAAVFNK